MLSSVIYMFSYSVFCYLMLFFISNNKDPYIALYTAAVEMLVILCIQ